MERKRFDRGETIAAMVAPDMGQLDANTAAAGEQSALKSAWWRTMAIFGVGKATATR
jgi:hypothetical protein